jgi:hypothetical protein
MNPAILLGLIATFIATVAASALFSGTIPAHLTKPAVALMFILVGVIVVFFLLGPLIWYRQNVHVSESEELDEELEEANEKIAYLQRELGSIIEEHNKAIVLLRDVIEVSGTQDIGKDLVDEINQHLKAHDKA